MSILQIGILALTAILLGRLRRGRELSLLGVSAFVVYWLQPPQPYTSLVFWLPTATLVLVALSWALTALPEARSLKKNWPALLTLAGVILMVDFNQWFGFEQLYMTTTPPVIYAIMALCVTVIFAYIFQKLDSLQKQLSTVALLGIVAIFIFLKTPALANSFIGFVDSLRGQDPVANRPALAWLGFSYIAFRLLHTLRDRQAGRLPVAGLGEYITYVIFFPAFTAGPIDRLERFLPELRKPIKLDDQDWVESGRRFFIGLFKKFVLADALAVIALNDVLAGQVKSAGWMWLFLYAYSLRIFFDFSGYTDIAIGLARVMGIRLPENFTAPYRKPNLTQFWNSWHITLTQWFRMYFFNPLTRALRSGTSWSVPLILFVTQVSTMVLIGLWHGISWGFVLWGLWHGLGLFIQNRWSEFVRGRLPSWTGSRPGQIALQVLSVFLTFNFVSLGWLFFTLSSPQSAVRTLLALFGVRT
jgi:alginate O-acetyltransferase complex protein AlgI